MRHHTFYRKFWPNYYPTKTADSFWKHEYEKHGTCSQSLPDFDSELKYFNKSLDLNALYDLEKGMREKLVPREKPYDRSTFELSLKAGVSENRRLEISCVRDKKVDDHTRVKLENESNLDKASAARRHSNLLE